MEEDIYDDDDDEIYINSIEEKLDTIVSELNEIKDTLDDVQSQLSDIKDKVNALNDNFWWLVIAIFVVAFGVKFWN